MESYRTVRALAAIKEHMETDNLQDAYELVMQLNTKKIKNVQDLNMMAQVCLRTEHYEEAKEITHLVYERTFSRRALSQLVELAIKSGQAEEAEQYLEKYKDNIKMAERMPDALSGAMGNQMYLANFSTKEELDEFYRIGMLCD